MKIENNHLCTIEKMDYKTYKRYVVSFTNDKKYNCICKFLRRKGDNYYFKVINSISSEDCVKYEINTSYEDGKVFKFHYDELVDYDNPVSVYLIDGYA
jgi:predicted secreted protein